MEVVWHPKALKQLKKIPERVVQERILAETRDLAGFPECVNCKKLTDHNCDYRLRGGRWRILFKVFRGIQIVSNEEVRKRNERTY